MGHHVNVPHPSLPGDRVRVPNDRQHRHEALWTFTILPLVLRRRIGQVVARRDISGLKAVDLVVLKLVTVFEHAATSGMCSSYLDGLLIEP